MFYNFKTNFEKNKQLGHGPISVYRRTGAVWGSEDFGCHDKIYLPDSLISLCNIHMILRCLVAMAIAMAANSL